MDNATFARIDAKLFHRLHWGPLDPVTFRLNGGQELTGQVMGVYRNGATGELRGGPTGQVLLATALGETAFTYEQISEIE